MVVRRVAESRRPVTGVQPDWRTDGDTRGVSGPGEDFDEDAVCSSFRHLGPMGRGEVAHSDRLGCGSGPADLSLRSLVGMAARRGRCSDRYQQEEVDMPDGGEQVGGEPDVADGQGPICPQIVGRSH